MMYSKIDRAIAYGESLLGVGRGRIGDDIDEHYDEKGGPFWASNAPVPSLSRVRAEGCVCTGLIALMMREAGIRMPFLGRPPVTDLFGNELLKFGLADTDEWLYHYREHVEEFSPTATDYPRGTLLLRPFNPFDMGHMAMLVENSSYYKPAMFCKSIHTIGVSLNEDDPQVVSIDKVEKHHFMYLRGYQSKWDRNIGVRFGSVGYYTHVLRPKYYV